MYPTALLFSCRHYLCRLSRMQFRCKTFHLLCKWQYEEQSNMEFGSENSFSDKKKVDHFSFETDTLPWQCGDRGRGVGAAWQCREDLSLWRNFPPGVRACGCIMNMKPGSHHHGLDHGVNTSAPLLATSFIIDETNLWVLNPWSLPRSEGQCMHGHSGGHGHQWDSHLPLQTRSCSETDRTRPAKLASLLIRGKNFGENWPRTLRSKEN